MFEKIKTPYFFKKIDFKMISVLWRFPWPAFGGPKILAYIYTHIYIYTCIFIYLLMLFAEPKAVHAKCGYLRRLMWVAEPNVLHERALASRLRDKRTVDSGCEIIDVVPPRP